MLLLEPEAILENNFPCFMAMPSSLSDPMLHMSFPSLGGESYHTQIDALLLSTG